MVLTWRRIILFALAILVPALLFLVLSTQATIFQFPPKSSGVEQLGVMDSQPPRGTIFDRNWTVLAVSTRAYNLRINTHVISKANSATSAANLIAPVVSRPVVEVRQKIDALIADSQMPTPTLPNILYSNLSPQVVNNLTTTFAINNLDGIVVEPSWARVYPLGPVAGPTVGFVGMDGKGYSGVEGFYDAELTSEGNLRKETGKVTIPTVTERQAGTDFILALDAPLESYVESRLARVVSDYDAQGGTVIVMDTKTGAILACASLPGYDPNDAVNRVNSGDLNRLRDPAVSDLSEPGAVFSLVTGAIAIEEGVITTRTAYTDTGPDLIDAHRIRNVSLHAGGRANLLRMYQDSLKEVAAQIVEDIGPERYYSRLALFGAGRKSGIDLQNEPAGLIRTPADADWSKIDMLDNSFGKALVLTPYQIVNAINVIANDGVLMQPYVVQQWRTQDGQGIAKQTTPVQRVISPDTARRMRLVIAESTRTSAPHAFISGYTVAGLASTARWYLRGGPPKSASVTYVGWVPAYEPRITILVKLDQPMTIPLAQSTALPVFHDVAERAVQILGIPPDIIQAASSTNVAR